MSYDLHFHARSGAGPTVDDQQRWFRSRPRYSVSDTQAVYENTDTGVYFRFEFGAPTAFNLNYVRPHVFGLEAEPEVAAFVAQFALDVDDPQVGGMGQGRYTREGFLRGWNAGNAFGYEAVLGQQDSAAAGTFTLPAETIERVWRWNYRRDERAETMKGAVFVPKIMFIDQDGKLTMVVVWPDGIPALLPEVDAVILGRNDLAPKRFLRRRQPDMALAPLGALAEVLAPFELSMDGWPHRRMAYEKAPESLRKWIAAQPPLTRTLTGVAMDHVLDAALFDKAMKKEAP